MSLSPQITSLPCICPTPLCKFFMPPSLLRSSASLIRVLAWSAEAGHVLV